VASNDIVEIRCMDAATPAVVPACCSDATEISSMRSACPAD